MSRKEVPRPGLVKLALAGQITNQAGAAGSKLTIRQFQRVKARYRAEGLRGLLHRRRGQPSPRALPSALRARVAALLQSVYRDVNDCHATEKLREVEGLAVSRASVRRIRQALGLPAKHRRRPQQHRGRRTPAPRMGALVLLDGSQFAWLRGPRAHHDAPRRHRRRHRHGRGVVLPTRPRIFTATSRCSPSSPTRHGLPLTLYGDRLNVFVRNDRHWSLEGELQGAQHPHPLRAYPPGPRPSATSRPARRRPRAASSALLAHPAGPPRGRQRLPPRVPRRLQSPLRPSGHRPHPGLAAAAPRPGQRLELVGSRAGAVRKAPVSSPRPFGRVEDWCGIDRLPLAVSAVSSSVPV